jgi:hypothetical protein
MSIYIYPFLLGFPFAFTSLVYMMNIAYIESKNKAAAQTALALYVLSNVIWSFFISLPQYIETSIH